MTSRPRLVAAAIAGCLAMQVVAAEDDTPQRTYLQALTGYYSPANGWEVFSKCRTEMEQPLDYSKADFVKLPISDIDTLAREAKSYRDLYQRIKAADALLGVAVMSRTDFWRLADEADDTVASHENAAAIWPQYRENMKRYGLDYKSAAEFLLLPQAERNKLYADSRGTQRSWTQAVTRRYTAAEGWKTYEESSTYLREPLRYTEYEFTHLPIPELDSLARSAKARSDLYERYDRAMDILSLEPLEPPAFTSLGDDAKDLVAKAEDAASKWSVYFFRMKAMGEETITQQAFFDLDYEKRNSLYAIARGTQRTTFQFMTRHYSADGGWAAYRKAMQELEIALPYTELEFRNFPLSQIDALARHAVEAQSLVANFASLCKAAQQPNKYTPAFVHSQKDLRPLQKEYKHLHDKWAARVVYANSCERIGVKPNWSGFESRSDNEQTVAASLSSVAAQNYGAYAALCDKLEIPKDPAFVSQSLEGQRSEIEQLSKALWDQRKETVALYAERAAEVAIAIAAVVVAYKAAQYANSTPAGQPEVARRPSRIDRNAFNKQRAEYWRNEASTNPTRYGSNAENISRMMSGRAPMGSDGFPLELHHPGGDPNATLIPMTRTEHRLGDNYMKNHPWMFEVKP